MLNESGKRAVHLAVSRYGADPDRVQSLLHSVIKAQGRGEAVDLLEVFLRAGVLSEAQAQELRVGLQKTRIDPFSPKNGFNGTERAMRFTLAAQVTRSPEGPLDRGFEDSAPATPNGPGTPNGPATPNVQAISSDPTKLARPDEIGAAAQQKAGPTNAELADDDAAEPARGDFEGIDSESDDGDAVDLEALDSESVLNELRTLGDYRILRRLGQGGTGAVFLAYQEKENRQIAIKVLDEQLARNQAALDRFYREAKSGALLNHPNIVRNLAIGRDQAHGLHYLVLEFIDGPSALELLDHFGRLPIGDAVHIVLDIARGLEHAHSRNVVHRDIKPGNILLTQSGLAKIADMGLAKRTDEASHLTHARQGFGTPYYMPYEQAMNAKYADARSDIYALGATFYHLLVGEVPFTGVNSLEIVDKKALGEYPAASTLNPDVPRALDNILARMLAKEPRQRYQTASELIVDLERSNLTASVPSFIDPDRAMRDPVVRKRLTAPAKTTSLEDPKNAKSNEPFWLLRYKDRQGHPCKAKLTYDQVVQRLRQGRIGLKTQAARAPLDDFKPLGSYKEFQDLDVSLAQTKPSHLPPPSAPPAEELTPDDLFTRRSHWWILALCGGVTLVVATTLILLLRG